MPHGEYDAITSEFAIANKSAKKRANHAIAIALNQGKLTRPLSCEQCSGTTPNGVIQAHHHLGYDREHWLTVQWLCARCHSAAHGLEDRKRAAAARNAALTPERRSEISRAASQAGRGKWLEQTTAEERSAQAKARYAAMSPEVKAERARKISESLRSRKRK